MFKKILFIGVISITPFLQSQNPLFIPDTLAGIVDGNGVRQYDLNVQAGTTEFFPGIITPTYGYNGNILAPTLILRNNDSVSLNVTNSINQYITTHWHGLHVAAKNDGGPHQLIAPNTTWRPTFKVRNEAATFWYHPHGEMKTEIHVTRGLSGMIIMRDDVESTYALPRKYGVDDFPLIIQTKAFDILNQLATATHEDTVLMVNATVDPFLNVPQQVVRFRLLNGNADRTFNIGLEDNSTFHIIGSDGGLLSAPFETTRARLSPGERVEILVDLSNRTVGETVNLLSYASELERGIIGADTVGTSEIIIQEGYYNNFLNGINYQVLQLNVQARTTATTPILTVPSSFSPKVPLSELDVDVYRNIHFAPDTQFSTTQSLVDGPFFINNQTFHMDSVNEIVHLNATEIWTLTNETMVAHPFHIHDIQFFVLDINGNPPPAQYAGLKDVILVMPNDTVRFITKFETFADPYVPYMYHCHLLHHEDEGMMGTFLVLDPALGLGEKKKEKFVTLFPNPSQDKLNLSSSKTIQKVTIVNALGNNVYTKLKPGKELILNLEKLEAGIYQVIIDLENSQEIQKIVKY